MERIEWEKGDRLSIRSFGELTKGTLRYPNMIVTAAEGGCSGGWDVYDATTEQGKSVSFYGFSVESLS